MLKKFFSLFAFLLSVTQLQCFTLSSGPLGTPLEILKNVLNKADVAQKYPEANKIFQEMIANKDLIYGKDNLITEKLDVDKWNKVITSLADFIRLKFPAYRNDFDTVRNIDLDLQYKLTNLFNKYISPVIASSADKNGFKIKSEWLKNPIQNKADIANTKQKIKDWSEIKIPAIEQEIGRLTNSISVLDKYIDKQYTSEILAQNVAAPFIAFYASIVRKAIERLYPIDLITIKSFVTLKNRS
jgi:hypothetical protein